MCEDMLHDQSLMLSTCLAQGDAVANISRFQFALDTCSRGGQRPASSSSAAPEDAFTLDVEDLYAENSISAAVAVSLLAKGSQAGVAANLSLASRSTKKNFLKNAARTMRNKKLKGTQWPDLYWFSHPQLFE